MAGQLGVRESGDEVAQRDELVDQHGVVRQRWLTTRFHHHPVAASVGAWGVVFPVKAGYYDVKHASLINRGSRWAVAEPGKPASQTHGEAGFGSALAPLSAAKQAVAAEIYER